MNEILQIRFPGGKKVDAVFPDQTVVLSDQARSDGGEGSAPQPFQLFLASIATCAGIYVVNFCETRKIPTDGMSLTMSGHYDSEKKRFLKWGLHLTLPESFPEKYRKSVIRAMDLCAVKKHILNSPEFEITTE